MLKKRKAIHIGILALTFEKMLQHLLTAVFFAVDVPGIGRPDIGSTFQLSDATIISLNVIVFILFGLGFWGRLRDLQWHRPLLVGLAVFDILAEFVFHGFFYITVSVIVSVVLLALLRLDSDKAVLNNTPISICADGPHLLAVRRSSSMPQAINRTGCRRIISAPNPGPSS